jgi:hypothetical protein
MAVAEKGWIMEKETSKTTVTMAESTEKWLRDEYPDALSLQEAIRTAISDARIHRSVVREYDELPDNG